MNSPPASFHRLLIAAVLLLVASTAAAQGTRVYKWIDEHGSVHYSDRLPASQLASNRQVLNHNGLRIRELDVPPPQPPPFDAEQARSLRDAQQEFALASSFENENELRRWQEERLGLIRNGLALARSSADKLTQAMVEQEANVASFGEGRTPPIQVQERLENTRRMLAEQNQEIVRLELRYDALLQQHSQELRRYREMVQAHE